jgi:hypothetical protein
MAILCSALFRTNKIKEILLCVCMYVCMYVCVFVSVCLSVCLSVCFLHRIRYEHQVTNGRNVLASDTTLS